MYPRVNYEMTEADLSALLEACKPVPYIVVGGYAPRSPQETANAAWNSLGEKMGFDYTTVQPVPGKGNRFFSAVPTENETQRKEREAREAEEKKRAEIERLEAEISAAQEKLTKILAG